ncbi:NADH-quinone oxidoreductase subunit N [bacterium]|nr:NADH-quinone oxidoreductase subunit N [bacterium]
MTFNPTDILAIIPEIGILALAMIVILLELLSPRQEKLFQWVAAFGLIAVIALTVIFGNHGSAFSGMIALDGFSAFLIILITAVTAAVILMSGDYLRGTNIRHGEYYGMLMIASCGMMILVSATDLVTVFLGIETMSISLYVLAGLRPEKARSSEAALKYFLLGAFATGFLLYGMALIYGASGGKTNLAEIASAITRLDKAIPIHLYAGVGLISIGLLFKVAAFPFHFWSPDVYQGSPTPVTAFMSVAPKAAAFAAFLRIFGGALPDLGTVWIPVIWVVAAVTMTVGNITALAQKDIKRMLAYSSISHAGYLLLAVLASATYEVNKEAMAGMMFYFVAYALMNVGAFTVAILISRSREKGDYQIDDYKGLAAEHPWIAAGMAIFLISLSGIPPAIGFFGKLYVFSAAVKAGFVGLVVIAVLNSVVSVYYYLRIVVYMYMRPKEVSLSLKPSVVTLALIAICAVFILLGGVLPGKVMNLADQGATQSGLEKPVAMIR